MADLIDRQMLRVAMYHEAFEKDSDEQRWDSGCWVRYKMFERVLDSIPSIQPNVGCGECVFGVFKKLRPKARDVYYEVRDTHCEFKCSLCGATIGVVEGGTLDGAWFKFCPSCGAEMEGWCERPD